MAAEMTAIGGAATLPWSKIFFHCFAKRGAGASINAGTLCQLMLPMEP